jgi:hypothetical protein
MSANLAARNPQIMAGKTAVILSAARSAQSKDPRISPFSTLQLHTGAN